MYRIVRTTAHAALHAELDQARTGQDQALTELDRMTAELDRTTAELYQAHEAQRIMEEGLLSVIRQVTAERNQARAEAAEAGAEVAEARAQVLLDAEDRVALRTLLRVARKQGDALTRVYVLFRRGTLHSLHRSMAEAERAAEAEGAPRDGWTAHTPGAAFPPAAEVPWRVQPLALGTP
ncbi:hypothetical protein [Streptomyces sp. Isolate_45]|uniref:hypothetical protein n=1 Tax=Streptomyces sp. Isolate_45 TaxID=2950111 RepID=UPI002482039A|nr:hypothetical protein [Streptomyces sp. Isolate_45]MDA5284635.1 hypothetical protein [Streptomyces sp. Isolate_45]